MAEEILGTAGIVIRALDSGFAAELEAKVKTAAARTHAEIPVTVEQARLTASFAEVEAKAKALQEKATVRVPVTLNAERFDAQSAELLAKAKATAGAAKIESKVTADTAGAESAFTRLSTLAQTKLRGIAEGSGLVKKGLGEIEGSAASSGVAIGAGIGLAVVAIGALVAAGIKGISVFQEQAAEVRKLKAVMGSTAEDASKLRNVAVALGTDVDALAKGFVKLSVGLVKSGGDFNGVHVETAKTKAGTTDFIGTVDNLRAAYQSIHDPVAKNVFLQAAMSRGGQELRAVLNATNAEFERFKNQGPIYSDKDLAGARDLSIAHRELGVAVKQVEVDLARGLVPSLASALGGVTAFLGAVDKGTKVVGGLGGVIDTAVHTVPVLGSALDLAQGHFKDAALHLTPVGTVIGHVFGLFGSGSKEASKAALEAKASFEKESSALKDMGVEVSADEEKTGQLGSMNKAAAAEALKFSKAIDDLAGSLDIASRSTGRAADVVSAGMRDEAKAFKQADDAASSLKKGLDILSGVHISADEAAIRFAASMAKLKTQFAGTHDAADALGKAQRTLRDIEESLAGKSSLTTKEQEQLADAHKSVADAAQKASEEQANNAKTLDINTEAGRSNRLAIIDSIKSAQDQEAALVREGRASETTTATYKAHIDQLRETAINAGFTKDEIDKLLGYYNVLATAPNITKRIDVNTYENTFQGSSGGTAFRAAGGPVGPGKDYYVGEEGLEKLTMFPGGGGYVTPLNSPSPASTSTATPSPGRSAPASVTLAPVFPNVTSKAEIVAAMRELAGDPQFIAAVSYGQAGRNRALYG